MKELRMYPNRVILGIYITLAAMSAIAVPGPIQAQELTQHVVEIYDENKTLLGSGTIISFKGVVLTAKHILVNRKEVGSREPNYILEALIRTHRGAIFQTVNVLAIHPFMDLAILRTRQPGTFLPLPIGKMEQVPKDAEVVLIGHRKGTGGQEDELYKSEKGKIDEKNRHGYIVVGRGVQKGFSGGPVIHNDRVIGVIRSTDPRRTTAVPIDKALGYFRLMGVNFTESGYARVGDDLGTLIGKVAKYEQILADIQMDVRWHAEINPVRMDSDTGMLPSDFVLSVRYGKNLSSQPSFDCKVSVQAVPIFKNAAFEALPLDKRSAFNRADWLLQADGQVSWKNIGPEIRALLDREYQGLNIEPEDFVGLDIRANISAISGKGFIRNPEERDICFTLRRSDDDTEFRQTVKQDGWRCVSPARAELAEGGG